MAGDPGARIVARVGVKVLPDVSGFRKKLRDDVSDITKSETAPKVKVGLEVMAGAADALRRQTVKAVNDLNREFKTNEKYRLRVPVELSLDGLTEKLEKYTTRVEKSYEDRPIKLRAKIDIAALNRPVLDDIQVRMLAVLDEDSVNDALDKAQQIAGHRPIHANVVADVTTNYRSTGRMLGAMAATKVVASQAAHAVDMIQDAVDGMGAAFSKEFAEAEKSLKAAERSIDGYRSKTELAGDRIIAATERQRNASSALTKAEAARADAVDKSRVAWQKLRNISRDHKDDVDKVIAARANWEAANRKVALSELDIQDAMAKVAETDHLLTKARERSRTAQRDYDKAMADVSGLRGRIKGMRTYADEMARVQSQIERDSRRFKFSMRDLAPDLFDKLRFEAKQKAPRVKVGTEWDKANRPALLRYLEADLKHLGRMAVAPARRVGTSLGRSITTGVGRGMNLQRTVQSRLDSAFNPAHNARVFAKRGQEFGVKFTAGFTKGVDGFKKMKGLVDKALNSFPGKMVGRLAGLRLLEKFNDVFVKPLQNIDLMALSLGKLTLGVGGLVIALLAASGAVLSFGASLVSIVPAALLLPGLLAGVATGAIVMGVALADIDKRMPELGRSFKRMQKTIQNNFWKEALNPFRALAREFLPEIEKGMAKVSTAAGKFSAKLATSLKGIMGPELPGMFDAVAASFKNLEASAPGIAKIVTVLGTLGAEYLPKAATGFSNLMNKWGDFLEKADKDGRLDKWVSSAVEGLKNLGRIISGISGTLAGLGKAALDAGGPTLASFADSMERLSAAVNKPENYQGIVDMFEAANKGIAMFKNAAGAGVSDFMKSLGGVMKAVMPQIGYMIGRLTGAFAKMLSDPKVAGAFVGFVKSLRGAIDLLAPSIEKMGPSLGLIIDTLAVVVESVAPVLDKILANVGPMLETIAPHIQSIIRDLGIWAGILVDVLLPPLREIVTALAPVLSSLFRTMREQVERLKEPMGAIFQALSDAIQRILPGLGMVLEGVIALFGEWIIAMAPYILMVIETIGKVLGWLFDTIITPLFSWLRDNAQPIMEAMTAFINGDWKLAWESIAPVLQSVWDRIKENLQPWIDWMKQKMRDLWQKVNDDAKIKWEELKRSIIDLARRMGIDVTGEIETLERLAGAAWETMKRKAKEAFSALVQTVKEKATEMVSEVGTWGGRILVAMANPGALLAQVGRDIVQGLIGGMDDKIGALGRKAAELASKVKNALTGLAGFDINSPSRVTREYGKSVVEGLEVGMDGSHKGLAKSAINLTRTVLTNIEPVSAVQRNTRNIVGSLAPAGTPAVESAGVNVNVTNHFPQAEPTSKTVNTAMQLAALVGR